MTAGDKTRNSRTGAVTRMTTLRHARWWGRSQLGLCPSWRQAVQMHVVEAVRLVAIMECKRHDYEAKCHSSPNQLTSSLTLFQACVNLNRWYVTCSRTHCRFLSEKHPARIESQGRPMGENEGGCHHEAITRVFSIPFRGIFLAHMANGAPNPI